MTPYHIRPINNQDRQWLAKFIIDQWGSDIMAVHGVTVRLSQQEGFLAQMDWETVGLLTYRIQGQECEITSLDSLRERQGIGSALILAMLELARSLECGRLYVVTTNDNLHALRFYQRRGFRLCALRPGAVAEMRKIKPEIPLTGYDDIPIRDEIELEMLL